MKILMKKIILLMLIMCIVFSVFHYSIANTEDGIETDNPVAILIEPNSVDSNGITLKAEDIIIGKNNAYVTLSFSPEIIEQTNVAGISAEITLEGIIPTEIESLDEEWVITASKFVSNNVKFLAELRDISIDNGLPDVLQVRIKGYLEEDVENRYAYLDGGSLKITDNYNHVTTPLEGEELKVAFREVEPQPLIAIKEEYESMIRIENNTIYAKINGNPETGMTNLMDLFDMLVLNETEIKYIDFSSSNESNQVTSGRLHMNILEQYRPYFERNSDFKNIKSITLVTEEGNERYTVYEMGNVYLEDVYIGGVINVNDVTWLRKAIIGIPEALEDSNFVIEAADVNFSNEERNTLGDVADVIAIRERILTYRWSNTSEILVIPETTEM